MRGDGQARPDRPATPDGWLQIAPFSEPDASFIYLERAGEPWSIHLEIELTGRLDPERLRLAVASACERHPMARARMGPPRPREHMYRWEIQRRLEPLAPAVWECAEEPSSERARRQLLRSHPRLDSAPPFEVGLLRRPGGDALVLNLHHAACDGIGGWRLMSSIWRAYIGAEDPVPAVDPLRARDLRPLLVPDSRRERLRRLAKALLPLAGGSLVPAQLAPSPGEQSGDGFRLIALDERKTAAVHALRSGEATVNDVLLAALALTIVRWNEERGADTGRISLMVPVNIRPPEWSSEIVGNFLANLPVLLPRSRWSGLEELLAAVAERTGQAKRDHVAVALFDLLSTCMRPLPVSIKERAKGIVPQARDRLQDTAILSNLGRLSLPGRDGAAGSVRAAWFSPPIRFTRGVGVGALSLGERLHLVVRHHRALLDDEAAQAFADLYVDTLLSG